MNGCPGDGGVRDLESAHANRASVAKRLAFDGGVAADSRCDESRVPVCHPVDPKKK